MPLEASGPPEDDPSGGFHTSGGSVHSRSVSHHRLSWARKLCFLRRRVTTVSGPGGDYLIRVATISYVGAMVRFEPRANAL